MIASKKNSSSFPAGTLHSILEILSNIKATELGSAIVPFARLKIYLISGVVLFLLSVCACTIIAVPSRYPSYKMVSIFLDVSSLALRAFVTMSFGRFAFWAIFKASLRRGLKSGLFDFPSFIATEIILAIFIKIFAFFLSIAFFLLATFFACECPAIALVYL